MRDEWREEGLGPTPPPPGSEWSRRSPRETPHFEYPGFYPDPQPARGMSACSYILGALTTIMGFYPPFYPIVIPMALSGLMAGVYARYRRRRAKVPYNTAKWGITLSTVGLVLGAVWAVMSGW